jgi:hypothetical protein
VRRAVEGSSRVSATTGIVTPAGDNLWMDVEIRDRQPWGRDLRYVLTWTLLEAGTVLSIPQLLRRVEAAGFVVPGRPSKTIADALRWEIARGRAVRVGRGLYRAGVVPRQTKSRIRHRVIALRRAMAAAVQADVPSFEPDPTTGRVELPPATVAFLAASSARTAVVAKTRDARQTQTSRPPDST